MGQCTVFALANFRCVIIDQIRHVHVVFNERLRTYCFRRKIDHNFCLSHPTADNRRDIKHLLATCDCCNLVYLQDVWENGYSGWRIHYSGGAMIRPPVRPPPPWCDREFCVIFAIFLWASFRDWTVKSVTSTNCLCFLPVKNWQNVPKLFILETKKLFFSVEGPSPTLLHPATLDAYGASPLPYSNPKYATCYSCHETSSTDRQCFSDHATKFMAKLCHNEDH